MGWCSPEVVEHRVERLVHLVGGVDLPGEVVGLLVGLDHLDLHLLRHDVVAGAEPEVVAGAEPEVVVGAEPEVVAHASRWSR